ncbi:uncharacterized protein [Palaemon carinicauda]|uniref:uncharacterized protein n=1 Tax=Palaemon carinicauda TaxID=392227 RepID=UPI0035B66297
MEDTEEGRDEADGCPPHETRSSSLGNGESNYDELNETGTRTSLGTPDLTHTALGIGTGGSGIAKDIKRKANWIIQTINAATNAIHMAPISAEFLEKLKNSTCDRVIACMDVESLFTNDPVSETINFIMDRVYRDITTPTLNIPDASLRALLEICTKKAPFTTHKGHIYIPKDGVAMGSPLVVLFADLYMGVIEEFLKNSANQTSMCATLTILS